MAPHWGHAQWPPYASKEQGHTFNEKLCELLWQMNNSRSLTDSSAAGDKEPQHMRKNDVVLHEDILQETLPVCCCILNNSVILHFDLQYDVSAKGGGPFQTAPGTVPLSRQSSYVPFSYSFINFNCFGLDVKCASSSVSIQCNAQRGPKGKKTHRELCGCARRIWT